MTTTRRHINLDRLILGTGSHQPANLDNGVVDQGAACLFEAVAFMAGERWSDQPECASPVLGKFGQALNDVLPGDLRQQLVPLVPRLIGTRDARDEARSYLALDWLIRVYTPTWLRLVPVLVPDADAIAGMPRIVDLETAAAVGDMVREASTKAAAAGDAAGDAARAAAWGAARAAAWDAAGDAAWAAAGAAAGGAARAAAWDAAGDAAWAAAWAAAGGAARAAAWAAAGDAAGDAAWAAAWAAAGGALKPTVTELQLSAIALFESMVDPELVSS